MKEFGLLQDFAIIMVVAGVVTLVFRKLHQPPILGYLMAGLLIGPYTFPVALIEDVDTVRLLADLGMVLLLFGLGLEFSWGNIRQIGLAVLLIGGVEIITMISLGYGLGILLGWSRLDAIFLGAALHISSSAIIVKILRDAGRLHALSSRIIVGILVVEDFAAIVILAVLSGMITTGTANLGDLGSLLLRLVLFVIASLVIGAMVVPGIIRFTHQFRSREALLITSLGLCFAMALLSRSLGLSVAAGAFLMGALIGDTEPSGEILDVLTPIRDMFAALFFVAIGMLIDVAQFKDFVVQALLVSGVFMLGKILINTLATFISGRDGRTALQVGMGMPQIGEFSLAMAKVGVESGAVLAPLYPVIVTATAVMSVSVPFIARSADRVAEFLSKNSPAVLRQYVGDLSDWLEALRMTFSRESEQARRVRRLIRAIIIDLAVMAVLIAVGTLGLQFIGGLAKLFGISEQVVAMIFGFLVLVFCFPALMITWRNLGALVDEASRYVLGHRAAARMWRQEAFRIVLRDSIVVMLSIVIVLWFVPIVARLLFIGSVALAVPLLLLAVVFYLMLRSVTSIYSQLRRTFSRVLLGEEYVATLEAAAVLVFWQRLVGRLARRIRFPFVQTDDHRHSDRASVEPGTETGGADREALEQTEEDRGRDADGPGGSHET